MEKLMGLRNFVQQVKKSVPNTTKPIEQKQSVRDSLGRMKGGDVAIEFAQNPDLIGGMRVKIGDDVYDGSMKTRLARLEEKF